MSEDEPIKGRWGQLAGYLRNRDRDQVESLGVPFGLFDMERRVALAEWRALDALKALIEVLEYLDEQERSNGHQ